MSTGNLARQGRISSLPLERWPAQDRDVWSNRSASKNPFGRRFAHPNQRKEAGSWKPSYRKNVAKAYGKWLTFLQAAAPGRMVLPPGERADVSTVTAFITALKATGLASSSIAFNVDGLVAAMRLFEPKLDWSWLETAAHRLRHAANPVRLKRDRTVPIDEVYLFGLVLMQHARRVESQGQRSRFFRNGLILALWAARPWRLANFTDLDLDRHFTFSDQTVIVAFLNSETKNDLGADWAIPETLIPFLIEYRDVHRGGFCGAGSHTRLWASDRFRPLSESQVARILGECTEKEFGVRMHPCSVRYSAATSAALAGPQSARTAMSILGHKGFETAQEYYVLADRIAAQRKSTAALFDLRDRLREESEARNQPARR